MSIKFNIVSQPEQIRTEIVLFKSCNFSCNLGLPSIEFWPRWDQEFSRIHKWLGFPIWSSLVFVCENRLQLV
jgi:hypothetical protein